MELVAHRGWEVVERHEARTGHTDSIVLELETDAGLTTVEGVVLLGKARLIQVDGIYCEASLYGDLLFMKNHDVPGVIGHIGTVLGRNRINIANFSLGRREAPAEVHEAIALVSTDGLVPETVLTELRENPAVKVARSVPLPG
jgi:D-3-phosphoglycerate dehydrogenase / 2-oxoglutarate reductase